jgi:hypothetical protein
MSSAADFLTSNLINAEMLDPNVRIEATIAAVRPHEYKDGTTKLVVYTDYQAMGVVLNQGRLKAMIRAFGVNYATHWVGKKIVIYQGDTTYQAKAVKGVMIEPIVATRIGTAPKPRLTTVNNAPSYDDVPPPSEEFYDGPGEDDINF